MVKGLLVLLDSELFSSPCGMEWDCWQTTGYNIRVPPSVWVPDATPNHTLVELPDDSGDHYAVIAAIHELHCLVRRIVSNWLKSNKMLTLCARKPFVNILFQRIILGYMTCSNLSQERRLECILVRSLRLLRWPRCWLYLQRPLHCRVCINKFPPYLF
jgi:hypothetical protein